MINMKYVWILDNYQKKLTILEDKYGLGNPDKTNADAATDL